MDPIPSPRPSWYFFLALESDLEATARYVEPVEANDACYSIEFLRLLTAAAAEVEAVAATLLREAGATLPEKHKISHLREAFRLHHPNLHEMEVTVPRTMRTLRPWAKWSGDNNPDWWEDY